MQDFDFIVAVVMLVYLSHCICTSNLCMFWPGKFTFTEILYKKTGPSLLFPNSCAMPKQAKMLVFHTSGFWRVKRLTGSLDSDTAKTFTVYKAPLLLSRMFSRGTSLRSAVLHCAGCNNYNIPLISIHRYRLPSS